MSAHRLRKAAVFVASPLVMLAIWELCGRMGWLDVRFFPLPTRIATHLVSMFREDAMLVDVLASLRRIGLGLLVGFLPGVLLGLAMGLSSWARAALGPLVALTYPIPKIAILPLLLIIFGLGETSNVMVVAIGVFFLALINTYAGVGQIPAIHFDVARVYRVRPWRRLTHIVLPAAFPGIFTGLKLAVGYGLILIVAAEMVAADAGIGYRIWTSWETYVIIELYASLAVISCIGVLLSVALEALERVLAHWKGS
jgi:ABC-type nitrate/sulfonate/bicarbonate transport system permease component